MDTQEPTKPKHAAYKTLNQTDNAKVILWLNDNRGTIPDYTTREHVARVYEDTGIDLNPGQFISRCKAMNINPTTIKSSMGFRKFKLADVVDRMEEIEAKQEQDVEMLTGQLAALHMEVAELKAMVNTK